MKNRSEAYIFEGPGGIPNKNRVNEEKGSLKSEDRGELMRKGGTSSSNSVNSNSDARVLKIKLDCFFLNML